MKVPTLMFAGVLDTYKDCCVIERARKLAEAAAKEGGKQCRAKSAWSIRLPVMALRSNLRRLGVAMMPQTHFAGLSII